MLLTATICAHAARAANLPDGRGFELVSPADTNGVSSFQYSGAETAVLSDDQVIFGGGVLPEGSSGSGSNPFYLATRGPNGWTSTSLLPSNVQPGEVWYLDDGTPSLSGAVFNIGEAPTQGVPSPTQVVPYRWVYRSGAGAFDTIATTPYSSGPSVNYGGMSADGQTVIFSDTLSPTGGATASGLQTVYAWRPGVGAVPIEGGPGDALAGCATDVASVNGTFNEEAGVGSSVNEVSADGSTAFLETDLGDSGPNCPANPQVYASIDGVSQEISISTDGVADPQASAATSYFSGATPDGRTAFFRTTQPLTSSAESLSGAQLYQWTAASGGTPAQVTCVSCGLTGDTGVPGGGVLVAPQGDYVYFVDTLPGVAGDGLYVYHDGTVEQIASDSTTYALTNPQFTQLSPDGSVIVFTPASQVTDGAGPLYRAVVDGSSVSGPLCITCGPNGGGGLATLGITSANVGGSAPGGSDSLDNGDNEAITADGDQIVFQTSNALGAADPADGLQVYEWTPSGGDQFIADAYTGVASSDAAITPDGQDVFFYSSAQLTWDATQSDTGALYDARVGGGFPEPAGTAACLDDACQGATPGGSLSAVGSQSGCCGNVGGGAGQRLSLQLPTAEQRRRAAADGRLKVRIAVHGAGVLRVRLTAVIGRRRVLIGSATRDVREPATRTLTLTVRLSRSARRVLSAGRRLTVTMTVSLEGARSRTAVVALRGQPTASTAARGEAR